MIKNQTKKVFVSGRVTLWSSRVTTRAPCLRPDSWLVEVYCKAFSYPLKTDYSSEVFFFSLHRLTKGFTKWNSRKALPVRVGLCELDGSRKLDYSLLLCTVSWWQRCSLCCSCWQHLKLLLPPTITETGNNGSTNANVGGVFSFFFSLRSICIHYCHHKATNHHAQILKNSSVSQRSTLNTRYAAPFKLAHCGEQRETWALPSWTSGVLFQNSDETADVDCKFATALNAHRNLSSIRSKFSWYEGPSWLVWLPLAPSCPLGLNPWQQQHPVLWFFRWNNVLFSHQPVHSAMF